MPRPMRVVIRAVIRADHLGHGHPRAFTIASRNSPGLSASTSRTPRRTRTIAHHAPVACPYQATTPENSRSICAATGRPVPSARPAPDTHDTSITRSRPTSPTHQGRPEPARSDPPPSPCPTPGTTAPTPAQTNASAPTTPTTTTTRHHADGTTPPAAAPARTPAPADHRHRAHPPGSAPAPRHAPTPPPPGPAPPTQPPAPTPPPATTPPAEPDSPHDPHSPLPTNNKRDRQGNDHPGEHPPPRKHGQHRTPRSNRAPAAATPTGPAAHYAARTPDTGTHHRHGTRSTTGPEPPGTPTSTARRGWTNFQPRPSHREQSGLPVSCCCVMATTIEEIRSGSHSQAVSRDGIYAQQ